MITSSYFNRNDPKEVLARRWTQPRHLSSTLNHNNSCELCSGIVICTGNSDRSLMCMYCHVSVHKSCLLNGGRSFSFDLETRNDEQWICFHCIDSLENSRKFFRIQMRSAQNSQTMVASQIIIAKNWRRMHGRRKYQSVYKILLRLQGWYRLRKIRNAFMQQMLEKKRIVKITIECADNMVICSDTYSKNILKKEKIMSSSYYLIIAAVDQSGSTSQQTWQNTSSVVTISVNSKISQHPSIEFNTEHWLPGVSGLDVVTISVIQKGSVKDFFLGQVCVDLSANYLWRTGGSFEEKLTEKYFVKGKLGMDVQYSYPPQPQGFLKFQVHVFNGLGVECGYVLGSPSEDFVRVLQRLPPSPAFLFSTSALPSSSRIIKTNLGSGCCKYDSNGSIITEESISFMECNTDPIKLPVVKSWDEMSIAIPSLKKKLWMAMIDGYILIYQHCGGPLRLILNISQFEYSVQSNPKGQVFSFHRFSYPSFHFQMLAKHDYLRWNISLLSNLRQQMNPSNVVDMKVLIVDIVDVKAACQKNAKIQRLNSLGESSNHEKLSDQGGNSSSPTFRPSMRRLMSRSYDLVSGNRPVHVRIHCQQKSLDDAALLLADLLPALSIISAEDELAELRFSSKKGNVAASARRLALTKTAFAVASPEDQIRNRSLSKEK
eukprot:gene23449-30394_t